MRPSITFFLVVFSFACPVPTQAADQPNIIVILADDMGYGDVHALNAKSTIPTPHLDQLAAESMTFTDAHSPSAVCTPTRYGLLTGRYCWRSSLKNGVLGGYSPPLIAADRPTIATMLRSQGYYTAAVGKWHLGMNMARHPDNPRSEKEPWHGDGNVDFAKPITDGPTTRGFDYYFGVSASLDMAPFVWIENNRFVTQPTFEHPGSKFPAFARQGPQSTDLKFDEVLDRLAEKSSSLIAQQAKTDKPFFLYLPLTGPHKPVAPHQRFVGKTKLGPYGDFIVNVDDTVGQVLAAVEKAGIAENTLICFTSDNGSFMHRRDEANAKDHIDDKTIQAYRADSHTANGIYRGTKADVWEAGHRVPFFVRWPDKVHPGTHCEDTICHADLYATAAALAGATLASNQAEDSFSILPLLLGKQPAASRAPVINHSAAGMFAIRDGNWKLVAGNGSGGRQSPKGKPFARPYQLFDLTTDPGETTNVISQHQDIATQLETKLIKIRESGRSRPGA